MKTNQSFSTSSTPFRKLLSLGAVSVILTAASTAYGQTQTSETLYSTDQSDENAPIAESSIGGPSSADQAGNPDTQVQAEGLDQVEFDQLDRDSDQELTERELEDVTQFQDKDSQDLLGEYDQDNDQSLSEQEYQQLQRNEVNNQQQYDQQSASGNQPGMAQQAGEAQGDPTASEGQEASDKPKIIVEQQPAKIVVEKPAPQVTIKQAKPKVRVTTRDPEIEVEQGEPEVSVNQPEPRVAVDQREPEVEVRDADPDVEVNRAEPEVQLRQAEPEVSFTDQEQQDSADERPYEAQEQQAVSQSPTQQSATGQAAGGALYSMSVERLRDADVVDGEGNTLGDVAEVVVKQDGSEVGFIIAPSDRPETEANYVYTSADEVTVEGDQLVMESLDGAANVSDSSEFQPGDFELAPRTERSINEVLQDPQFTQR